MIVLEVFRFDPDCWVSSEPDTASEAFDKRTSGATRGGTGVL